MRRRRTTTRKTRIQSQLLIGVSVAVMMLGIAVFVDDLHDFIPGAEFLHWLPDFEPVDVAGFRLHHLLIGLVMIIFAGIMLIGLITHRLTRGENT